MGGQVLGGGVIVLVAALLWLVYLLPSWHGRHQYNAAERNAVRLNQALRILAETSETPEEVRLELNARTAHAQQRLARRATAERESAELELARADLETARLERAAAASRPAARRARARRRARLATTVVALVAVGLAGWGAWEVTVTGSQVALWSGVALFAVCAVMLRRMTRVGARAAGAFEATRPRVAAESPAVWEDDRTWTPRRLPHPLTASSGSRAATELDAADARRELRRAAQEESLRARAERTRPPDIAAARAARDEASAGETLRGGGDAEIEAHVRELLARRAAG